MMPKSLFIFCCIIFISDISGRAFAQSEGLSAQFAIGQFEAVAAAGENASLSADDAALAAKAHLTLARFFTMGDDRLEHILAAKSLCEAVLDMNPQHFEATLQLSVAWGLQARHFESASDGRTTKLWIYRAMMIDLDAAYPHAALAGWHGEVVSRAGGMLARVFFGASRATMEQEFVRALEMAPNDIGILIGAAETFTRLNSGEDVRLAMRLLRTALVQVPKDAFETRMQAYGLKLLQALESGDESKIRFILDDFIFERDGGA